MERPARSATGCDCSATGCGVETDCPARSATGCGLSGTGVGRLIGAEIRVPVTGAALSAEPFPAGEKLFRWPDGSMGCACIAGDARMPPPIAEPTAPPCANAVCENIIIAAMEQAPSSVLFRWNTTCVIAKLLVRFLSPRTLRCLWKPRQAESVSDVPSGIAMKLPELKFQLIRVRICSAVRSAVSLLTARLSDRVRPFRSA
jgi:hypothetical protein